MKTILVPVDFSPVTREVFREATLLARLVKARIVLAHVIPLPVITTEPYGLVLDNMGAYMVAAGKAADRHLARLSAKLRTSGFTCQVVRVIGFPVQSLIELAKKRGADYIVIGSHGHTALYDMFVGSTTRGVLKRASCPVIVVPTAPTAPRKSKR